MRKHVQVCCSLQPQEESSNATVTLDLMGQEAMIAVLALGFVNISNSHPNGSKKASAKKTLLPGVWKTWVMGGL